MLRFEVLVSIVPLLAAAVFARGDLLPGARPCIAIGEGSVQITSLPWQAQSHVSFTRDPSLATVRVQITDQAETADFTVLDDVDSAEAGVLLRGQCRDPLRRDLLQRSTASEPVIYLSTDGPDRLPGLRLVKTFYGARCRRPDRRRQRRAAPDGRRPSSEPSPGLNVSLTTFFRTRPAISLEHFARSPRIIRRRDSAEQQV